MHKRPNVYGEIGYLLPMLTKNDVIQGHTTSSGMTTSTKAQDLTYVSINIAGDQGK